MTLEQPSQLPPIFGYSHVLPAVIDAFPKDEDPIDQDAPVFILASGFRTGSTLLQRLIMSSGVLTWGEPFMQTGWLFALAGSIINLPGNEYSDSRLDVLTGAGALHEQWVANLNPGIWRLKAAHRAMFKSLLADPAAGTEYTRWGAKFVRLDGYFAPYLRWLFPNCKIVFLVRDPLKCFQSYRRMEPAYDKDPHKTGWWLAPGWPINSADRFFAISCHLMTSFVHVARANDMKIIRYETITKDRAQIDALGDYLGLSLDAAVLDRKLNGMIREFPPAAPLKEHERQVIENWAPRFEAFGYSITP